MSCSNWIIQPESVLNASAVMPVLQISDVEKAIPLAAALFAGGIGALEVTLRTPVALEVIRILTKAFPEALIGAGTVITPEQLFLTIDAGAKFAFSPGQTNALLKAGLDSHIPLIPGIASISELMAGLALGYSHFKFFPAVVAGGVPMLRSIYGPFPQARFCPTGGIHQDNFNEYLALPNVVCVGGSWIVPQDAVKNGNWSLITELSKRACSERSGI